MRRFGPLDATALAQVLRSAAVEHTTGVVLVSGRGDGGRVWLAHGELALAHTDTQPGLADALVAVGAATDDQLARLRQSAGLPLGVRPTPPAPVAGVVAELTLVALSRLLALTEGSWRLTLGDTPPLGVLATSPVAAALEAAAVRETVEKVRDLGSRGQWRPNPAATRVRPRPREWELLCAMGHGATAPDLARRTRWSLVEVRSLMSELARRGVIERVGPPATATRTTTADAGVVAADRGVRSDRVTTRPPDGPPRATPSGTARPAPERVPAVAPVGNDASATTGGEAWAAQGGGPRAAALRRLIGAVRRG